MDYNELFKHNECNLSSNNIDIINIKLIGETLSMGIRSLSLA